MKTLTTKAERSLLLFLETRAVDHGGRVQTKHMNDDDMDIALIWADRGFLEFGRLASENVNQHGSHWCRLSEEAWTVAAAERKARAGRLWNQRTWRTTAEKRGEE